jgi:voltage-gated potassium channel
MIPGAMGDPATDGAFSVDAADTGRPVSAHAGLPPRRLLVLGAGRTLLSTTGVLVVYFVLPLDRRFSSRTLLILVLGLVGVGLLVAWQVRAILRARTPALRAVEALALSLPLFLVLFAVVYVVLSAADAQAFSEPLTHMDSLYFVVTVFATVGFGDIAPVTEMARAITTVQMVGDLLLIGLVLRMFLAAVNQGRRHAQRLSRPASGAASPGGDLGPPSAPPTDGGLITPAG